MHYLAKCLRFYVHDRMNNNIAWQNIKVILSDANVPGEGEHKIVDYIRRQRGRLFIVCFIAIQTYMPVWCTVGAGEEGL